jgi:hypothetical protein
MSTRENDGTRLGNPIGFSGGSFGFSLDGTARPRSGILARTLCLIIASQKELQGEQ